MNIHNNFGTCSFCKKTCDSLTLSNNKGGVHFKYLDENSSAHFECYIDHCVKILIEKHILERRL
jgi:hypothetical protein